MNAFVVEQVPLTESEASQVRTCLASEGYRLLREILAAHAAVSALAFTDASLYTTAAADTIVEQSQAQARKHNDAVEVLDHLAVNVDEWFRIKIDQRRS